MGLLRGKTVVVSGSTRGIGKAIARHFVQLGARVVVNGRQSSRVSETVEELRSEGGSVVGSVVGSVGDISELVYCNKLVDDCVRAFGSMDYLVNNAGISMEGDVADLAPSVFQKVFETNVLGSFYLTKASLPHLKQSRGGVVFISSSAAIKGIPGYSAYCASKMALNGFAESLKLEMGVFGVYVGIAQVGFTENDQQKRILGRMGQWVPQPERPFVQPASQESVARQVAMMIQNRKSRHVFGNLSKCAEWLNRLAPGLYELVLRRHYQKNSFAPPALDSNDQNRGLPGQHLAES